jgi:hypothetical protein
MFAGRMAVDDKRGDGREEQLLRRRVCPRERAHAPQLTKDEISFWQLVSPQRAGLKIGQERHSGLRLEVLKIAPQALGRVLTVGHTGPIQIKHQLRLVGTLAQLTSRYIKHKQIQ